MNCLSFQQIWQSMISLRASAHLLRKRIGVRIQVCPQGHVVWNWTSQPAFKFGMLAGDFMLGTNILLSGNNYSKVALLFRLLSMGMLNTTSFHKIQDTYCVDTITEFWEDKRSEVIQRLRGQDVVCFDELWISGFIISHRVQWMLSP